MCGIAGLIEPGSDPASRGEALLRPLGGLLDALRHRGPDDRGDFVDPEHGVALGMVRLSIIDLAGGHQPLVDDVGRRAFVFNGELYNYKALRADLEAEGARFATRSDTEVAMRALVAWGAERALDRFDGMFAFALWEADRERLLLARDSYGEKPLYYVATPERFAFASELPPLVAAHFAGRTIESAALVRYLALQYNDGETTLVSGARRLLPGHLLTLAVERGKPLPAPATSAWFDPFAYCTPAPPIDPPPGDGGLEAQAHIKSLLESSVSARMVADVPVGVFLSGGLDSTIAAYEASRLNPRIHTFSIGFEDPRYNESEFSRLAARALGTTHAEFVFTLDEFHEGLRALASTSSEPLADAAVVPTALLAARAREKVKVVLSGEGGDEIFGGYAYYHDARPLGLRADDDRRAFSGFPRAFSPRGLRQILAPGAAVGLDGEDPVRADAREHRRRDTAISPTARPGNREFLNSLQTHDIAHWLPGDLLAKLDGATMAHSLEGRAPFLNRALHQAVFREGHHLRAKNRTAKYLLKLLYAPLLPEAIVFRAKQGFGLPVADWLRDGRMRALGDEAMARLAAVPLFRREGLEGLWREHLERRRDHHRRLLTLIVLALWMERHRVTA